MALFLFHSKLLDFKRFRRTATAQRCLLDRNSDAVRRVEIGEHIVDIQHTAVDTLRLTEIRIAVLSEKIDVRAFLTGLRTHARRDVGTHNRQRFSTASVQRQRAIRALTIARLPSNVLLSIVQI